VQSGVFVTEISLLDRSTTCQ